MYKLFESPALAALLNVICATKNTAGANAAAVSSLQSDFTELSDHVTNTLQDVVDTLNDKQPQIAPVETAIPLDAWKKESSGRFPWYADIAVENLAATDGAQVNVKPASMESARDAGFASYVETMDGKIRVRAQLKPGSAILAEYCIVEGVTT